MSEGQVSSISEYTTTEQRLAELAPAPTTLEETGLSESFLGDLVTKHLLDGGVLSLPQLSERLALVGKLVEQVVQFLRAEALVEVLAGTDEAGSLRFSLTDRGRRSAQDGMQRNGYVGAAPVPLQQYTNIVRQQTVHDGHVTRDEMEIAFADVVLRDGVLDQIGPSLNSGRAIFIYGPAGTGKTYIAQRLSRLFTDEVLIPHAIAINESVVAIFDPVMHKPIVREDETPNMLFKTRHDARWMSCERPVLISGGELTAEMLEVQMEPMVKEYRAPLQLKANNGIFIIDDMGRQRIPPETVFNRWIVPMEEQTDYLSLGSGRHFSVPFDLVLVFSTNMNPTELADEAFLRRIGYKILFEPLEAEQYRLIWRQVCEERGIVCSERVLDYVIENLHGVTDTPMLPCHPRDLLGIASDQLAYLDQAAVLDTEHVRWAWNNYFVSLSGTGEHAPAQIGVQDNV